MLFATLLPQLLSAAETGRLPDRLIRYGIQRLLAQRRHSIETLGCEKRQQHVRLFLRECAAQPIAVQVEHANQQHYEVPSEFFQAVLGPRLKYSCCEWNPDIHSLDKAEQAALETTCMRADLKDGMRILELGCGWGSLSLWIAERYPSARITAVSNSNSQRRFIEDRARQQGVTNLHVLTADVNDFCPEEQQFDRVLSVEMFEHVRNHQELLRRISTWLFPRGRLFVHLFCHRDQPYLFEDHGPQDWMSRHFFTGGMMPSDSLLLHYQRDLRLLEHWRWNGRHYERTCNTWLENMDQRREILMPLFQTSYGTAEAERWWQRWRIFFMACAELFGFADGNEWWVAHYLFEKPR